MIAKILTGEPNPTQGPSNVKMRIGTHHKRRKKLNIVIVETIEDSAPALHVTLSLPLDPYYPAEAKAMQMFVASNSDESLDVTYIVRMNFKGKRQTFEDELRAMYSNAANNVLGIDDVSGVRDLAKVEPRELRRILAPLAALGANIFETLFLSEDHRLLSHDEERHGSIVRGAIASVFSRPQIISIKSPPLPDKLRTQLFPWAFLYDDCGFDISNEGELKPESFWGFKHQIQESIEYIAPVLALSPNPSIMTAVCSVADKTQYHKKPGHTFKKLGGKITEVTTVPELGVALKKFTDDCFYFYGHAFHPDPPEQTRSWVKLQNVPLTVDTLKRNYKPEPKNKRFAKETVLTFLNGCETAPLNIWDDQSFAGYLSHQGKWQVCCVATVASVPGRVAATFGHHFWKLFLIKKLPLGDALYRTRKVILRKWNNPLGLLYTVLGNVDTHVGRDDG
jgi:hypothetical protein